MNSKMKSFYSISNIDFNDKNLVFIPDTNILLSLYLFEDDTFTSLTNSMKKSSSAFWIPYNVALEYQRNRINQIKSGEQVRNQIDNCFIKINKSFEDLISNIESRKSNKYQSLIDEIRSLHTENKKKNDAFFNKHHTSLPSPTKTDYFNDKVRVSIDDLIGDNVGEPYDQLKLDSIYSNGEERYKNLIPPGFKDAQRKDSDVFHYGGICYLSKFGDLVIWHQILEFIASLDEGKKVVFVTNDLKDDWWIKLNDIKIPHYSLKQEALMSNTGVDFDMLTADEFFKSLAAYKPNKNNQAKVISDIDRVIEISLSKNDYISSDDDGWNYEKNNDFDYKHKDADSDEFFSLKKKLMDYFISENKNRNVRDENVRNERIRYSSEYNSKEDDKGNNMSEEHERSNFFNEMTQSKKYDSYLDDYERRKNHEADQIASLRERLRAAEIEAEKIRKLEMIRSMARKRIDDNDQ